MTALPAPQPSDEDIRMAHAAAAKDLVNIDPPERKRRVILGSVLSVRFLELLEARWWFC